MANPPFATVTTEDQLNQDLAAIAGGTGSYTISFGSGFTLNTDLLALNLGAGGSLTLIGNGQTINGAGTYRGLFDYSGALVVNDLTIARGGSGGTAPANGTGAGAGGAGLGGGLFVASAGNATLNNVTFTSDSALGGSGGNNTGSSSEASGGGGGLGGNGGNASQVKVDGVQEPQDGSGGGIGLSATGGTKSPGGPGIIPTGPTTRIGGGGGTGSGKDYSAGPGGVGLPGNFGGGGWGNDAGFGGGGIIRAGLDHEMTSDVHLADSGESECVECVGDRFPLWVKQAASRNDMNGHSEPRHAVGSSGGVRSALWREPRKRRRRLRRVGRSSGSSSLSSSSSSSLPRSKMKASSPPSASPVVYAGRSRSPRTTAETTPYVTYSMPTGKKKSFGRKIIPNTRPMSPISPIDPRSVLTLKVGTTGYGTLLIIRNARPAMRKRTIVCHGRSLMTVSL